MYNSNVLENFCLVGLEAIFSKPSLIRISEETVALKKKETKNANKWRI
jgi:hypothetical protein